MNALRNNLTMLATLLVFGTTGLTQAIAEEASFVFATVGTTAVVDNGSVVTIGEPLAGSSAGDHTLSVGTAAIIQALAQQTVVCAADLNGNGAVEIGDLLEMLSGWGSNPGHPGDLDGDGFINIGDLLDLLAAWGPCV